MTDRRGPQAQAEDRSVTAPDLTPEEARAEVEAFMGEGWDSDALTVGVATRLAYARRFVAGRMNVEVEGKANTYRAAVAALKQAWRDAARPWMEAAIEAKLDTADVDGYAPTERVVDRVCEKGMSNG